MNGPQDRQIPALAVRSCLRQFVIKIRGIPYFVGQANKYSSLMTYGKIPYETILPIIKPRYQLVNKSTKILIFVF